MKTKPSLTKASSLFAALSTELTHLETLEAAQIAGFDATDRLTQIREAHSAVLTGWESLNLID
jgi:hypothetical protein